MTEQQTEKTSKKASVMQAAIGVGLLLVFIVIAAVTFTQKPDAPAVRGNVTPPAPVGRTAPGDFMADSVDTLTALRSQQPTPGPRTPPLPVDDLSQDQWNQLLDALGNPRSGPPTTPAPSASASQQKSQNNELRESRLASLTGVIAANTDKPVAGSSSDSSSKGRRLPAGTILDGALAQQVSSDYPGSPFIATITRPARLPSGEVAIPAGSKIIGSTALNEGPNAILQGRITLNSAKIVRPDGSEIALESRLLDAAGVGAVPGPTNRHVLAQAGGVLAYALIGASTAASTNNDPLSTGSQYQTEAVQGAGQQVAPVANRYLSVIPTVTPTAGTPVRIVLTDALSVSPYLEG